MTGCGYRDWNGGSPVDHVMFMPGRNTGMKSRHGASQEGEAVTVFIRDEEG